MIYYIFLNEKIYTPCYSTDINFNNPVYIYIYLCFPSFFPARTGKIYIRAKGSKGGQNPPQKPNRDRDKVAVISK